MMERQNLVNTIKELDKEKLAMIGIAMTSPEFLLLDNTTEGIQNESGG
jgi:hypothetical protein